MVRSSYYYNDKFVLGLVKFKFLLWSLKFKFMNSSLIFDFCVKIINLGQIKGIYIVYLIDDGLLLDLLGLFLIYEYWPFGTDYHHIYLIWLDFVFLWRDSSGLIDHYGLFVIRVSIHVHHISQPLWVVLCSLYSLLESLSNCHHIGFKWTF